MSQWIITSSVLIVAVMALRYLVRGKISLRLQYGLWALVLVRLLVPFSIGESPVSVMNLAQKVTTARETAPVQEIPQIEYRPDSGTVDYYGTYEPTEKTPTTITKDVPQKNVASTLIPPQLGEILTWVWWAGMVVSGTAFLVSNGQFGRKLRRNRTLFDVAESSLPVYIGVDAETSCLYGVFSPAIYLTGEVLEDEQTIQHVVAHEATHFRHGDNIWSFLRCICLCIHWYNPLVWLAAALSRQDGELACDEGTLQKIGENQRIPYGETLIGLTCTPIKARDFFCTATTMSGGKRSLKERITLIARKPKMAAYTLVAVILIGAVAVGCTFTGAEKVTIGAPIFDNDSGVTAMTLTTSGGSEILVGEEYLAEMAQWVQGFTYGEKGEGPAASQISVAVTFEDGSTHTSGIERTTAGDTAHLVERSEYPTCWSALWNGVDVGAHIGVEATGNFSEETLSFARDYVTKQIDSLNQQGEYTIIDANITGLTEVDIGTLGLDSGVSMYLLEYRLLPDDMDKVPSPQPLGTEMIDGQQWMTESGSQGRPYLLLVGGGDGTAETVALLGVIHTTEIMEYDTDKMLETYDDAYQAAAMELYNQYMEDQLLNAWLSFVQSGSAQDVAEAFVNHYSAYMLHLATNDSGGSESIAGYELLHWRLLETNEDDSEIEVLMEYAVLPAHPLSYVIWGENGVAGEGKYEGWITKCNSFLLEQGAEGEWHCTGTQNRHHPMKEEIGLGDLSVLDLFDLCIYRLNSDGAFSELATGEMYDRFMADPEGVLDTFTKTGGTTYNGVVVRECFFHQVAEEAALQRYETDALELVLAEYQKKYLTGDKGEMVDYLQGEYDTMLAELG